MKKILLLLTLILVFVGCSSVDEKTREYSKSHELIGNASWYGKDYHKKLTASGEKYNMRKKTAAHKTLPFGTIVKVTNLENGKDVEVKINDRGPYAKGRIIDLSRKAFSEIADIDQGVIKVKIEIVDDSKTFRYKH